MNMWRFSNRRLAGEARGVWIFMVCIISLLSSAGCALQRTQSAGDPFLREEKLARIDSLSLRNQTLQHKLAELQSRSETQSERLMLELESAKRESAEAENRAERLEIDLAAERDRLDAERGRHSEDLAGYREEIAALNERIAGLESSVENLLSQISVIRARHQVETTRLKKEIERLSGD